MNYIKELDEYIDIDESYLEKIYWLKKVFNKIEFIESKMDIMLSDIDHIFLSKYKRDGKTFNVHLGLSTKGTYKGIGLDMKDILNPPNTEEEAIELIKRFGVKRFDEDIKDLRGNGAFRSKWYPYYELTASLKIVEDKDILKDVEQRERRYARWINRNLENLFSSKKWYIRGTQLQSIIGTSKIWIHLIDHRDRNLSSLK